MLPDPDLIQNVRTAVLLAWLLPLMGSIWGLLPTGVRKSWNGPTPAAMSTVCIALSFVLSLLNLLQWQRCEQQVLLQQKALNAHAAEIVAVQDPGGHGEAGPGPAGHGAAPLVLTGAYYTVARVGGIVLAVDYYIDGLTVLMMLLVTGIALAVHLFSQGYLADEAQAVVLDEDVLQNGQPLARPGRQGQYFAYLSMFCFAMLGLVQSGSLFLTFVFWELVGATSFLLIGFYHERMAASAAAVKAFIYNRVGDAGFLIGLSILLTYTGTLSYADLDPHSDTPGLFDLVRGSDGEMRVDLDEQLQRTVVFTHRDDTDWLDRATGSHRQMPYGLLVAAGLGLLAGCVGKSAQFPLQGWLPDAMAGPTPVSALVHSATMVAAGVYLIARISPILAPEVLLVVAYLGAITLLIGAMTAVAVTDIKRVLAYSTISQLGYMLLGLGVGGWTASVFHLVTHACFKALLFLSAGSVIRAMHHVQDLTRMGGLSRRMPITAICCLVGAAALAGLAVPFSEQVLGIAIAFSGYHSKDAILSAAMAFGSLNPLHIFLFAIPVLGAGLTAYYIARLWLLTFWGQPRDPERYAHVEESPRVMWLPLVGLAVCAAVIGIGGEQGPLAGWIHRAEPLAIAGNAAPDELRLLRWPGHEQQARFHASAAAYGLIAALAGLGVAIAVHGRGEMPSEGLSGDIGGLAQWLRSGWRFDEMYATMIVQPAVRAGDALGRFDRQVLDAVLHRATTLVLSISRWDRQFDEQILDGTVNRIARATQAIGRGLSLIQTGRLRQYITLLAAALVLLAGLGIFIVSR